MKMTHNSVSQPFAPAAGSMGFRLHGIRFFRYLAVIAILIVPALIFLDRWLRYRVIDGFGLLSAALVAVALAGFISQFWSNRAVVGHEKLVIQYRSHTVRLPLALVQAVYRPQYEEELDQLSMPEDHVPLEFDARWDRCVLIIFKDGAVSESPGNVFDGLHVKYVTVSPTKPDHFIYAVQSRL